MKNLIKRWLDIGLDDIVIEKCGCCDDDVTANEVISEIFERLEALEVPKKSKKIKVQSE